MAACNLEFDKIQTISASNSNADGFKYYDADDADEHFGNFATSRKNPNKNSSIGSGGRKQVRITLVSSYDKNLKQTFELNHSLNNTFYLILP